MNNPANRSRVDIHACRRKDTLYTAVEFDSTVPECIELEIEVEVDVEVNWQAVIYRI